RIIRILFDLDNGRLTPESKDTLNLVVDFLKRNPKIKIELASHTDQRGSVTFNKTLSKLRAKCCANYIYSKGIDSARVMPKGYGSGKPLIPLNDILRMKTNEEKEAAYARNR